MFGTKVAEKEWWGLDIMNLVQRTGNSRLSDADWNRTAGSERQIGEKVIVGSYFW